jgi:VacB/RNase II family 3'-5' exoribonuclease
MSVTAHRSRSHAVDLDRIAREAMRTNGFDPELPGAAVEELSALPEEPAMDGARDLRALPWSSIDNRESRDLDQVEVAEALDDGGIRLRIGIADVSAFVPRDSALDRHAASNTTSVYTGAVTFPMLPERLSTDLTSLNEGEARRAVVLELTVDADGGVGTCELYEAVLVNRDKLAYEPVGQWLVGATAAPLEVSGVAGIAEQVRLQDEAAQRLRARRQERGALDLETIEARPVTSGGEVVDLRVTRKSRARELIEDFMIAANTAIAQRLERAGYPSIRRVVHMPKRWPRIVDIARSLGEALPADPDAVALSAFLWRRRAADPDGFASLSLSVVKLLGSGEYVVDHPGARSEGHFGLAVDDYTHSTAPNRRYADLVTQRMLKALIAGDPPPYTVEELESIAARCTVMEGAANKVERQMRKVVAASLMARRRGERFDAIVTGASPKGVYVRLVHPPAEGRVVRGEEGLDVGERVSVTLLGTDVERGFIDFGRA